MKLKLMFAFSTVFCFAIIIASNGVQDNIRALFEMKHQMTMHRESNRLFNGLGLPDKNQVVFKLNLVSRVTRSER